MTAPEPTHLRDANSVGNSDPKFLSDKISGQSPLRGALFFATFFWASKESRSLT